MFKRIRTGNYHIYINTGDSRGNARCFTIEFLAVLFWFYIFNDTFIVSGGTSSPRASRTVEKKKKKNKTIIINIPRSRPPSSRRHPFGRRRFRPGERHRQTVREKTKKNPTDDREKTERGPPHCRRESTTEKTGPSRSVMKTQWILIVLCLSVFAGQLFVLGVSKPGTRIIITSNILRPGGWRARIIILGDFFFPRFSSFSSSFCTEFTRSTVQKYGLHRYVFMYFFFRSVRRYVDGSDWIGYRWGLCVFLFVLPSRYRSYPFEISSRNNRCSAFYNA